MGVKGLKKEVSIFWQTTNSNHSFKLFYLFSFSSIKFHSIFSVNFIQFSVLISFNFQCKSHLISSVKYLNQGFFRSPANDLKCCDYNLFKLFIVTTRSTIRVIFSVEEVLTFAHCQSKGKCNCNYMYHVGSVYLILKYPFMWVEFP